MKDKHQKMNRTIAILLLVFTAACNNHQSEELVIKEMTKAADLLSKQNHAQFHRIEKLYQSDTSKKDIKSLYTRLSIIRESKEIYKANILQEESPDIQKENKLFVEKAFNQLDEEEQKFITQKFKDSPILNEKAFENLEQDLTLPSVLALEAEMVTQEMFLIVLKDFNKVSKNFDWEIYW